MKRPLEEYAILEPHQMCALKRELLRKLAARLRSSPTTARFGRIPLHEAKHHTRYEHYRNLSPLGRA